MKQLLMLQATPLEIGMAVISGLVGVFCVAAGVVGYFRLSPAVWQRVVIFCSGVALMDRGIESNLSGAAAIAVVWGHRFNRTRACGSDN